MGQIKDKRSTILKTTLALITERGFHATPMSMIAKEAKVSVGVIYRYFKNKEELINVLFRELKAEMNEATFKGDLEEQPTKLRFQLVWKNVLHYYISNPQAFKFIEQYYYSSFIDEETEKTRSQLNEPITQFFEEFRENKQLKNLPVDALYAIVHGPIVSLAKFHLETQMTLDDNTINNIVETIWEAITL